MSGENLCLNDWHKKQAIDNFNLTWDYIDKTDRTKEDELNMIHAAHTSRFHWGQIGTPLHFARGEWQISRVYSILELGDSALLHGDASLKYCLENDIKDFDLAFAYEAVARAYMIKGDKEKMSEYVSLAEKAAVDIEKQGDKDYFLSELKTIN